MQERINLSQYLKSDHWRKNPFSDLQKLPVSSNARLRARFHSLLSF
jgi:hypothetical protein